MRTTALATLIALLATLASCASPRDSDTARAQAFGAKGPVGWESLRRLDALPLLRPGVRTRQSSSHDPTGFNNDGFRGTSSCRRRTAAEGCVIAEHQGPGELASIWFTRDRGVVRKTGRLRIELDGRAVVNAPLQDVVDGRLGAPFAFPLVANREGSSGGVYIKVPMPFRQSMKVSTQTNPLFHHVTYRTFPDAGGVPSFDPSQRAGDVLARMRAAGLRDPKPATGAATTVRRPFRLAPGARVALADGSGPAAIDALRIALEGSAAARAQALRTTRLQVSFDGQRTVDSPLGEFFGSGVAPASVRALMMAQAGGGSLLSSWWPMPFLRSVSVSLVNTSRSSAVSGRAVVVHSRAEELTAALAAGRAGRFHATSRRGRTVAGRPWTVLATAGPGVLVGVSHSMRGPRSRRHLEGDERVLVDGEVALPGTGTEDFYEGGWYFIRGPFSRPLNGAPAHRVGGPLCPGAGCTSAYRLLISDAIAFSRSLRFEFEHGNRNQVAGVYGTTAYWYG